jgi:antitoxin component HigA of HigAB toxin-antitoxin module
MYDEVGQLFAQKNQEHEDEVVALQARVKQLETESPEEKYHRLCIEKNAKIEALKSQMKEFNKEDEILKTYVEGQEKVLRRLRTRSRRCNRPRSSPSRRAKGARLRRRHEMGLFL